VLRCFVRCLAHYASKSHRLVLGLRLSVTLQPTRPPVQRRDGVVLVGTELASTLAARSPVRDASRPFGFVRHARELGAAGHAPLHGSVQRIRSSVHGQNWCDSRVAMTLNATRALLIGLFLSAACTELKPTFLEQCKVGPDACEEPYQCVRVVPSTRDGTCTPICTQACSQNSNCPRWIEVDGPCDGDVQANCVAGYCRYNCNLNLP
jgi:hypothetical protein